MNKTNCLRLGKILKSFGYQGEMVFLLDVADIESLSGTEFFFIDIDEELVPFLVEQFTIQDLQIAIVKLEDVNTIDKARQYAGCDLYLPKNKIVIPSENNFDESVISGFEVIDMTTGSIGQVKGIDHLPEQDLLIVVRDDKEILIPAVDEIIREVDIEGKRIMVDMPQGLMDLNF